MNMQTLLDEREIRHAHYRYAHAHDERDWEQLRTVFTPDVVATYGTDIHLNGPDAMIRNTAAHLGGCGPSQHMMSNFVIRIADDTAESSCYIRAFHAGKGEKAHITFSSYAKYSSSWRRTSQGWRAFTWTMKIFSNIGDASILGPG
jgi:hypothetical protein